MKKRTIALTVTAVTALFGLATDSVAQVPFSNRCFTPSFWCFIQAVAPVGTPCYCATPYGPVSGVLR